VNALQRGIRAAAAGAASVEPDGTVVRRYRFDPGFAGFDGHFPGAPILPAIVQIQAAVDMASEHAGAPLRLAAVEAAKFLAPVRPGEEIHVRLTRCESGGKPMLDAVLTVAGKTAASFLLQLVPDGRAA
jgi:3-hydroxyacyl-[acyl-carrier-protein] dehydratase